MFIKKYIETYWNHLIDDSLFLDQTFWLLMKFSNIDPLLHSHSGQLTRCQNFISSRWSAKIAPPVASRNKIPNCYIRTFYKEPFFHQKTMTLFSNMIRRSLVWVFEMLGLEIDLLFVKIIEFDFSWVDQCHVKCLFIKPTTKSWTTNRLDTINSFLGSLFDQLMVNWCFG